MTKLDENESVRLLSKVGIRLRYTLVLLVVGWWARFVSFRVLAITFSKY